MNMFKKSGGFTLVELIVVIAILAILAGVAVPVYSGYIKSANEAADEQEIEAVNTAIAAALAMEGKNLADAATYFEVTDTKTLEPKDLDANAQGIQNAVWDNFEQFYGITADELDVVAKLAYYKTIALTNGEVVPAA